MPLQDSCECQIVNEKGLHVRAAAEVVKLCQQYDAQATIAYRHQSSPTNSIIKLVSLGASHGSTLTVTTEGPEATELLQSLKALIAKGFYE